MDKRDLLVLSPEKILFRDDGERTRQSCRPDRHKPYRDEEPKEVWHLRFLEDLPPTWSLWRVHELKDHTDNRSVVT